MWQAPCFEGSRQWKFQVSVAPSVDIVPPKADLFRLQASSFTHQAHQTVYIAPFQAEPSLIRLDAFTASQ